MNKQGYSIISSFGHENSFDSLVVERKMILKMNLASNKFQQDGVEVDPKKEPYAHLKARNVFGKHTVEYNK